MLGKASYNRPTWEALLLLHTTPSYSIGVFEDFEFLGDFLKDFGWIFRSFCEFGGLFVNFEDYLKDFGGIFLRI